MSTGIMLKKLPIYHDYCLTGGRSCLDLSISKLTLEGEDLFFLDFCNSRSILIASGIQKPFLYIFHQEGSLLESYDFTEEGLQKIRNGFALIDGSLLLQSPGLGLFHFSLSTDKKLTRCSGAGDKLFHGSCSIDQSSKGTIMYAEYTTTKDPKPQPLRVYKSLDGGKEWSISLELTSSPLFSVGQIRHFHTCQADPFVVDRWYVSTGDKLSENRLYYTNDDGKHWKEVAVRDCLPRRAVHRNMLANLLRFTALSIQEDFILWPTDDNVGGNSSLLCKISKQDLSNDSVMVYIDGILGRNLSRSIVDTKYGNLILSESKHNANFADMHISSSSFLLKFPPIENLSKSPSAFALSRAVSFNGGRSIYSSVDSFFLNSETPSILRFDLICQDNNALLPCLEDNIVEVQMSSKIVFFHAQRTAGTFLKSLFISQYGKEKCLFYQTSSHYKKWADLDADTLSRFKVYGGHENFSDNSSLSGLSKLFISIVRNPLDRAISLYQYIQNKSDHRLHEFALSLNIVDFYKKAYDLVPDYVSNTQTLRVTGKHCFQDSKRFLDQNFYLLAPFERLSEVVEFMSKQFKWSNFAPIVQKQRKLAPHYWENDELLDLVYKQNQCDYALYEYSKMFFTARMEGCQS